MIPYGRHEITRSDINAIIEVLKSDFLTQGPKVPLFEKVVSEKVGAQFGIAVNSATSALHIACNALGLGKGDWLWTTPISFVASANCGLYCGAKVDFVDIDPISYNICPVSLEAKLMVADKSGRLPKVLVAVHLSGQPCDMVNLHRLSQKFGFRIIEDASHAIGGKYENEYIGNCRYSDITVFSFHPVKIITSAEGGMALTNCKKLAESMEMLRSHGITRDPKLMTHQPDGPWYYQQVALGYNYRMTELQAALGLSQMERLDKYVEKRHKLARLYDELLEGAPLTTPIQHPNSYSAMHLYIVRLNFKKLKITHLEVFNLLRERGIGVNIHYIPIHTHPYYQQFGFKLGDFPQSESYYSEALSLPIFPTLLVSEVKKIAKVFLTELNSY
jgi:UDP-4-amino-4,6-dideoxy-N-acetyl-beta-L-altrosamine transaminase